MSAEQQQQQQQDPKAFPENLEPEFLAKILNRTREHSTKNQKGIRDGDETVVGPHKSATVMLRQERINAGTRNPRRYCILYRGSKSKDELSETEKSNINFVDPERLLIVFDLMFMRFLFCVPRFAAPAESHRKSAKDKEEMVLLPPRRAVGVAILRLFPQLLSKDEEKRKINIDQLEVASEEDLKIKNLLKRLIIHVRVSLIKQIESQEPCELGVFGPSVLVSPGLVGLYEKISWTKDLGVPAPPAFGNKNNKKKASAKKTGDSSSVLDSIAATKDDAPLKRPASAPKDASISKKKKPSSSSSSSSTTTSSAPKRQKKNNQKPAASSSSSSSLFDQLIKMAEQGKEENARLLADLQKSQASSSAENDAKKYRKLCVKYKRKWQEAEAEKEKAVEEATKANTQLKTTSETYASLEDIHKKCAAQRDAAESKLKLTEEELEEMKTKSFKQAVKIDKLCKELDRLKKDQAKEEEERTSGNDEEEEASGNDEEEEASDDDEEEEASDDDEEEEASDDEEEASDDEEEASDDEEEEASDDEEEEEEASNDDDEEEALDDVVKDDSDEE